MRLGTKLLIAFLCVGVIPFSVVGITYMLKAGNALSEQAFGQLESMRAVKKAHIESFFKERHSDMGVLLSTVDALRKEAFEKLAAVQETKKAQLTDLFDGMKTQLRILKEDDFVKLTMEELLSTFAFTGGNIESAEVKAIIDRLDPRMKGVMKDNGWKNIYLMDNLGSIIYSFNRGTDLGLSIPQSELSNQGIGKAFKAAQKAEPRSVIMTDLEPYAPLGGEPTGFMMAQILDETEKVRGYIAFQIPQDQINKIMLRRNGMGKTGESYLVGQDNRMRSDSFLDKKGYSVDASFKNGTTVNTEAVNRALAGEKGQQVIISYNGNPVLSCWDVVDVGDGVRWAIISEIEVAEAFCPVDKQGDEYFAKYAKLNGYEDLFLFNPDGYCFYTVAKKADYQSNFINGEFSDSGLGKLVKKVIDTQQFGFADFEPYAPSEGAPAAFIAQPVVHEEKIEVVVGLQLSLTAINSVMQQRQGMGETGETYLVGPDKLMRSDSYFDPVNHSVKAAFANPEKGRLDTEASREALAGITDQRILLDHSGNRVLSAYTPVKVGNTKWALIAEIKEDEAFASVKTLKWLIGLVAIIGIAAIIGVALLVTRSISKPINRIIGGLNEGASRVSSASGRVSYESHMLAEGATEQAASIEETSSSLEEMSSMTKQNADNAHQADNLMKEANQVVGQANESMKDLIVSMEDISKASEETSKIIKTIDEIAFQTNLLALNAAVEAARAGDAGAGFAVVADEVRNLALRAADAAQNTADLIESTVKKVNDGSDIVTKTNEAFERVAGSASKVGELVSEIAAASNEQAQGIELVNKAVSEMDKVVQQNAAGAGESASASEQMKAQAEKMKQMVDELVALIGEGLNSGTDNDVLDNENQEESIATQTEKQLPAHRAEMVDPEEIIPIDDSDFKDF